MFHREERLVLHRPEEAKIIVEVILVLVADFAGLLPEVDVRFSPDEDHSNTPDSVLRVPVNCVAESSRESCSRTGHIKSPTMYLGSRFQNGIMVI